MDSTQHVDEALIQNAASGCEEALAELFQQHRLRLHKMLSLRIDPKIRARTDASDILQETYLELSRRLPKYTDDPKIPFFLWLRMIAGNCLARAHRKHLGAAMRNAGREVSLTGGQMPGVSTMLLASQIAGNFTSVDRGMVRAELQLKIQEALKNMSNEDREILALRHFEELTTEECSHILGVSRSGVLKRHTKAIRSLRDVISRQSELKPLDK